MLTEIELRSLGIHRLRDITAREAIFQLLAPGLWAEFPPLNTLDVAFRRGVLRAAAVALVVIVLLGGLAAYAFRQRNAAIRNALRADRNLQVANARTRENTDNLYVARTNLIQSCWENDDIGRIPTLLDETHGYSGRGFEWSYWNRLCHLDRLTLTGHTSGVRSVCFSPDGRRILTGSWGGARLWDAVQGRERLALKGHGNAVYAAGFSPDGQRILTGSRDGTAKVWFSEGSDGLPRRSSGMARQQGWRVRK